MPSVAFQSDVPKSFGQHGLGFLSVPLPFDTPHAFSALCLQILVDFVPSRIGQISQIALQTLPEMELWFLIYSSAHPVSHVSANPLGTV